MNARSGKSSQQFKRSKWLGGALISTLLLLTFVALQMRAGFSLVRKAHSRTADNIGLHTLNAFDGLKYFSRIVLSN